MGSPVPTTRNSREAPRLADGTVDVTAGVTVGIVAALWIEGLAMRALIEDLDQLPPVPDDPGLYYAGHLPSADDGRPHRVVVTTMPRDSTRNAAAICTNLIRSFPDIQVVVMTGIAGGVPVLRKPERHVRLGDVVVATDGLVDWSHIRQVDGSTEPRRHVEGMSDEMIRAAQELRGHEFNGNPVWAEWLDPGRHPGLEPFARPKPSTDVLYLHGVRVRHPSRRMSRHPDALPKVHYGRIASGDVLLRDEKVRDELAAKHDVVAVEMESSGIGVGSAGLSRRWFVVRGVADYCESRGKNDTWHPYASLSAAAYVRALLSECRPFPTSGGHSGGHEVRTPVGERAVVGSVVTTMVPSWQREVARSLAGTPFWQSLANRLNFITVLRTKLPPGDLVVPSDGTAEDHLAAVLEACGDHPAGVRAVRQALEAQPASGQTELALRRLRELTVGDLLTDDIRADLERLADEAPPFDLTTLLPVDDVPTNGGPSPSLAALLVMIFQSAATGYSLTGLLAVVDRAGNQAAGVGDARLAADLHDRRDTLARRWKLEVPRTWPRNRNHDLGDELQTTTVPRTDPAGHSEHPAADEEVGPDPAGPAEDNMSDMLDYDRTSTATLSPGRGDQVLDPSDTGAVHARSGGPPAVWGNVPPRNPHFIGRQILLDKLHRRLRNTDLAAVLPQAIHGMGGVGKSQLAIEYVYRHQSDYDVIWWIPAEQPQQVLSALTDLAQHLGLPVGPEANTAVPAVKEALRQGRPFRNWLLVFDNAEDLQTVQNSVPTGGAGKVLVTSRNADWSLQAETLEVDVFSRDESIRLLRRRDPDIADHDAHRLAEALGDLPLAIEQAAAWRAVTGMAASEYLELLRERAELLGATADTGYGTSVAAAWTVSLDRLEASNPAAMRLLEVCAFFAPEPITRNLFLNAALSDRGDVADEFQDALRDPIKLSKAIRDLQKYALAKINHRTNTIELHRLVQAVVVDRVEESRRDPVRHLGHRLLAAANPHQPENSQHWDRYQSLISHVNASRAVDCGDQWVRTLVFDIVRYLYQWGDHEGCEALARGVHSSWQGNLGPDDSETLQVAQYLGFIYWVNGKFQQANSLSQDTLDRYERIAEPGDEGLADAKLQVARDLRTAGRYDEAVAMNQEVAADARRQFGEDEPFTLRAAHELAISLRLAGRYLDAREVDERTLALEIDVFGASNPLTLNTNNGFTIDQRECGDYNGARAHQEDLYTRYIEHMGEFNPQTIRAARNLAVARRRAGDHDGALALSRETEKRFRERYGEEYPDAVASAVNLAVDLRHDGALSESIELASKTLNIYRGTLGENHPFTLSARTNLAIALRLFGGVHEAREHNVKALTGLRDGLGPDHPLSLIAATNLASDLYSLGEYQQAFELDTDTLDRSRRQQGDDHPSTLACNANLALDLRALGRVAEADAVHRDVINRYRRVLGDTHAATVAASRHLRADCDVDPMPL